MVGGDWSAGGAVFPFTENQANRVARRRLGKHPLPEVTGYRLSKLTKVFLGNILERDRKFFGVAVGLWVGADALLIGELCSGSFGDCVILGAYRGVSGKPSVFSALLLSGHSPLTCLDLQ